MKNIVYIDGQNFLYRTAEVLISHNLISSKQDLTSINIRALLEKLFPMENLEIRFYGIAHIRKNKSLDDDTKIKAQIFADNFRRIRSSLAKQNINYIASGTLIARDSEPCKKCGFHKVHFIEKGVDVSLATSLVNDAATNQVDKIILLSSDMDMLPAITLAKDIHHKSIVYVGFAKHLTAALLSKANDYRSIRSQDIINIYLETNQHQ